jgi:hypothetical protein
MDYLKLENILNQTLEVLTQLTLILIQLSQASTIMIGLMTGELSISQVEMMDQVHLSPNNKAENTHNQISEELIQLMLILIQLSQASIIMTGQMTGELSISQVETTVQVHLLPNKLPENTHNQTSEELTQLMLIQIPLSPHLTTMTGLTTGELSTSLPETMVQVHPLLNKENILNQILEVPTQSTLIQTPPSQASITTIGLTTGEITTLSVPNPKNIHNQILEDKTHKTLTPIALSPLIYTMIGQTTGLTTNTDLETTKMITISVLTSITSSFKLMPPNILNQTLEVKTHRTLTLILLSPPICTTIGPTIGSTTNTDLETIKMITISVSTTTTNSDWETIPINI